MFGFFSFFLLNICTAIISGVRSTSSQNTTGVPEQKIQGMRLVSSSQQHLWQLRQLLRGEKQLFLTILFSGCTWGRLPFPFFILCSHNYYFLFPQLLLQNMWACSLQQRTVFNTVTGSKPKPNTASKPTSALKGSRQLYLWMHLFLFHTKIASLN